MHFCELRCNGRKFRLSFSYSFYRNALQDEVPASLLDSHIKNVEASVADGKFDPAAGLSQVKYTRE